MMNPSFQAEKQQTMGPAKEHAQQIEVPVPGGGEDGVYVPVDGE